ncbi:DUF3060 domain-containing protein [Mycobacterium sp. Root135]|uniref:DUF3060 domain-containing protein n=1 Tax=Mycobacterium sp. Root135 TaxID=1736457 RepID=UPI00138F57FE|nr:DUF3060 domain-containing protein [Mycobacterium sp. Root135]
MSSQDDPEARIRDLERSLSEQASELTHSSYDTTGAGGQPTADAGHWPPPPNYTAPLYGAPNYTAQHQPYGTPYPPTITTSTGGGNRGWILYVVMAVVVVAIIGGAVSFLVNALSTVSSVVESFDASPSAEPLVPGGGGPFDVQPSRSGGNRPPAPTITSVVPPAPGDVVNVSGVGEFKTIACNGNVVNISGVDNTVVITGQCANVSVSGVKNEVTVEGSVQISASGMENRVTYLSGTPVIDNSGMSNVVVQG